jgi:hypothetical protein
MKSQLTDKTRKAMWAVFPDVNPLYFKAGYKRETVSEFCDLLNFGGDPLRVAKYPPVLYPEDVRVLGTRDGNQTKLFQGKESHMVRYPAPQQLYLLIATLVDEGIPIWCRIPHSQFKEEIWSGTLWQEMEITICS